MFVVAATCISGAVTAKKVAPKLTFDAGKGLSGELTMPQGQQLKYTAYTKLYFVTQVEDSTYQYLNIFVPEGATQSSPIFMRTYVGGYMASEAGYPQAGDATGRALQEGYVVVIPGSRGRNSTVKRGKKTVYTGRAPKALLDLKAAVRYLRYFDKEISGDAEKIITDGTSAGGAMSALLGATGSNPAYEKYLVEMGAASVRDDVFASVCFCPITDLEHADMAYEWLYGNTSSRQALANITAKQISAELSALFPAYVNSLTLHKPDGTPLTADNYLAYIKQLLIESAQFAKDAGADIPDSIGFRFSNEAGWTPPLNGGVMPSLPTKGNKMPAIQKKQVGEYITDLDMSKYLNYVSDVTALKGVPAFDSYMVGGAAASGENGEFGDTSGSNANFTEFAASKTGKAIAENVKENVRLLNPMNFIGDDQSTVAQHWYIRHGARDRDTAFSVPINLAMKLQNAGKDVNFKLPWNRPHSGDYALNELFEWLNRLVK